MTIHDLFLDRPVTDKLLHDHGSSTWFDGGSAEVMWAEFDRWNDAIANVVFSEEMSGLPVYLDLDEDVAGAIAQRLDLTPEDFKKSLTELVQDTLDFSGPQANLFTPHRRRLAQWRRSLRDKDPELNPPPIFPLLAVTVLAAEDMGTGSSADNAYYQHLNRLLNATDDDKQKRVQKSYQAFAEPMWDAVDEWLTRLDGRHGVPTAFALSKRFVGLPMSQALVRAADRRKLIDMFDSFNLPPGYAMAPGDMVGLFDQWVSQQPCPASKNLEKLWRKSGAQGRIAEVVVNELLIWDGSGPSEGASSKNLPGGRGLRMLSSVTRGLGKTKLQLTLVLRSASQDELTVSATSADGSDVDLTFIPGPGGLLRLHHLQDIDMDSVIDGVLTLTSSDESSVTRYPRAVIPLGFDEVQGAYVESERVQLLQDTMLLVRDQRNQVEEVERILGVACRPGFVRHETSIDGLPRGWVLFTGVEFWSSIKGNDAQRFNELVPLASAQLSLSGGLKLPSGMSKWSSLAPPEIRAVSQHSGTVRVEIRKRIYDEDNGFVVVHDARSEEPVVAISIANLHLDDGDYRVSIFENGNQIPTQTLPLSLRSGHTVDARTWFGAKRLWHDFSSGGAWGVMSASETHSDQELPWGVDGPYADGVASVPATSDLQREVWWTSQAPEGSSASSLLAVSAPDESSCVMTGAHHLILPTVKRGGPQYIDGVCKFCGLVKRQPAWAKRPSKKNLPAVSRTLSVNVSGLTPASDLSLEQSWAAALDGLMHLGGGKRVWLERIARYVDGSALFVHRFVKAVQALGIVDTSRDATLQVSEWELAPRYLAQLGDDSLAMIGYWPREAIDEAVSFAEDRNAYGVDIQASEAITVTTVSGLSQEDAAELATRLNASVVWDAASSMLKTLPTLGAVGDAMKRIPVPGGRRIEHFHVPSASWTPVKSTGGIGAFRVDSGYGWRYLFRNERDVASGDAAIGDSYLVKHLAAREQGRPLVAYDEKSQSVVVPYGADLPGLYERALVLFSGQLPQIIEAKGAVSTMRIAAYRNVPTTDAQRLYDLMGA